MTAHSVVVVLPAPLMLLVLTLDLMGVGRSPQGGGRLRALVMGLLGVVAVAVFTGMGARRTLPAAVPGVSTPWDTHVSWAVALLFPIVGLGIVRVRAVGPGWTRAPLRLILLDLAVFLLLCAVSFTGLRIR